jgi:hypothetical protein
MITRETGKDKFDFYKYTILNYNFTAGSNKIYDTRR